MAYFGLIAILALAQRLLAGFIDLSQATWTQPLNPAVLLRFESLCPKWRMSCCGLTPTQTWRPWSTSSLTWAAAWGGLVIPELRGG